MSAGAFVNSRYLMNNGDIAGIRVQQETIDAQIGATNNNPPVGAVNFPVSAKVSATIREYGLKARTVTLKFPVGGAPAGYKEDSPITIPALSEAFFDAALRGVVITYLGVPAEFVGKSPERIR